jgi:hypothetical protein
MALFCLSKNYSRQTAFSVSYPTVLHMPDLQRINESVAATPRFALMHPGAGRCKRV